MARFDVQIFRALHRIIDEFRMLFTLLDVKTPKIRKAVRSRVDTTFEADDIDSSANTLTPEVKLSNPWKISSSQCKIVPVL